MKAAELLDVRRSPTTEREDLGGLVLIGAIAVAGILVATAKKPETKATSGPPPPTSTPAQPKTGCRFSVRCSFSVLSVCSSEVNWRWLIWAFVIIAILFFIYMYAARFGSTMALPFQASGMATGEWTGMSSS
jgi:hypothetical protein